MIRPCTLPAHWKQTEPFDAMKIRTFLCRPVPYHTQTKKKTEYRIELFINDSDSIFSPATTDHKELERYKFEAITTIAEALNAPVEAKKEVLAGLEYKEVIGYCDAGLQHSGVVGNFAGTWKLNRGSWGLMDFGLEDCGIYKVKAKEDDPKTAEYLRQFTLDGVRIKEGG